MVLRLFRGESVEEVSREIQVPVHELERWRRGFLDAGVMGLKRRGGDPEESGKDYYWIYVTRKKSAVS